MLVLDSKSKLKITFENGLLYEGGFSIKPLLDKVDFSKRGLYRGCVHSPQNKMKMMFTLKRVGGALFVKDAFGRFPSFSCSLEGLLSSLLKFQNVEASC